jgi:hypothetical protein
VERNSLPDDFAAQLEGVLAPGEASGAALVLAHALRLDDEALGAFLESFAVRIGSSPERVTAGELRSMLVAVVGSRRSASQRSSQ